MTSAARKWEFCGDEQPHERHEWIDGMIRRDCPGAPTVESLVASGQEFPDVPVRPGPVAAMPRRTPPYTELPSRLVVRCQDHPTYRGLGDPREECPSCEVVHRQRGATVGLSIGNNTKATVRVGSA